MYRIEMPDRDLDQETADRMLDAERRPEQLPDEYEAVAGALDDLRLMRAEPDPVAETEAVRAMIESSGRSRPAGRRRPRLFPTPVRVALALGGLLVLTSAGAAIAGTSLPTTGPANSVLENLGLDPDDRNDIENELRDRENDRQDFEADEAERQAEGDRPLPHPAGAGRERAAAKREGAARFTGAVRQWTACVAIESDRHESSGATTEFDPVAACGQRPRPADYGVGRDDRAEDPSDRGGRARRVGPPAGGGPPTGAGPPAGAGRPPHAGPPRGVGPPADAGPPAGARPPGDAGQPSDNRRPRDAGPPATAGPPLDSGPPADAGPPAEAGPPAGIGPGP